MLIGKHSKFSVLHYPELDYKRKTLQFGVHKISKE
jgi:hypothetical protein